MEIQDVKSGNMQQHKKKINFIYLISYGTFIGFLSILGKGKPVFIIARYFILGKIKPSEKSKI